MMRTLVIVGNSPECNMLDGDRYVERVTYLSPKFVAQYRPSTGQVW